MAASGTGNKQCDTALTNTDLNVLQKHVGTMSHDRQTQPETPYYGSLADKLVEWANIVDDTGLGLLTEYNDIRKQVFQVLQYFVNYKYLIHIKWSVVGTSIVESESSDLDIVLTPMTLEGIGMLQKCENEINALYNSYFCLPMHQMFEANIYAIPFFYYNLEIPSDQTLTLYKGRLNGICFDDEPCVRLSRATTDKHINQHRILHNGSPQESPTGRSTEYGTGSPTSTQCKSVTILHPIAGSSDYESYVEQQIWFSLARFGSTLNSKEVVGTAYLVYTNYIKSKTITETKDYWLAQYIDSTKEYRFDAITAINALCMCTFYVEDAYHSQGAVLDVTIPEDYQCQLKNKLPKFYFVCSVFDNLGFIAELYMRIKGADFNPNDDWFSSYNADVRKFIKITKYVDRIFEAFIKLDCVKYDEKLAGLAKDINNVRKTVFNPNDYTAKLKDKVIQFNKMCGNNVLTHMTTIVFAAMNQDCIVNEVFPREAVKAGGKNKHKHKRQARASKAKSNVNRK